jgi:putative ABC transport system permease protein
VSAFKGITARTGQLRTSRLRGAIVGVQVAGSALLLIVSTLFVRAAQHAARVDPGYAVDNVISFSLNLGQLGYTPERARLVHETIRQRTLASPGVEGVGFVWPLPLLGRRQAPVLPLASPKREELGGIAMASVTPGVFATLGLRIIAGRSYTDADVAASGSNRPAVVSQSLAKQLTANGNAVGTPFRVGDQTYVVTGIAADARYTSLGAEHEAFVYMPPSAIGPEELSVIARTRGSSAQLERALPRWVHEIDPNIVVTTQHASERVAMELKPVRVASMVAGAAGMLAMFLALVGIYGVVSYAVSGQTRDIAVRQALGASRGRVVRMVLQQGSRPIVIALAVSTLAGLGLAQVIRKLLFGVSPLDPLTYLVVLTLLIGASAAAMYAPARRATRISPAVALRED